ncbi:RNA-binding protein Rsf1 [Drosophila grimshawi]|uniref:GH13017 n=1 Tax=Drosophila grimshawi TaxID=7222 RepID=B4JP24_DROGR|nr:RNA-binding protein Rsf1 [Drosophila grimshawi]EDV99449.1 GH13017 [Drosophila grimshawi]
MTDQRGTRVYVGNLTDKVKKDDLEGEFTKYGKLNSVWIAFNPPGFAFVEFEHRDDAEKACDILNGSELLGSQLRVEISKGRPRQGRRGGPGDRGRRGDVGRHSITNSSSSSSGGGYRQQRGSTSSSSRHLDRGYSSGRSSAGYGGTSRDGGSNGFNRRDVYSGARESSRYGGGSGSNYGRNSGGQGGRYRSRSPAIYPRIY